MASGWQAARTALRATGDRFASLVRASDPDARVTEHWTVAQTAAHVGSIAHLYTGLVGAGGEHPLPELREVISATRIETVSVLNDVTLRVFTERDTARLADKLREDIDTVLEVSAGLDPQEPVSWLGDARVPRAGVLSHLVNEMLVHGWDIAGGRDWDIPQPDAALFFDEFMIGLLRTDAGRLLDHDVPPSPRPISVAFRSRYTRPATLVVQHGKISVRDVRGDEDVRIRFRPATLNLMNFHRISKARAALSGGVLVSGPRPWLLPRFLRVVRLP